MACTACARPSPPDRRPDIVLLSLDTFRADLLEMDREEGGPELPALTALAAESVRFDRAWSPVPFTLPAHMTLLTGVHPVVHGVDEAGEVLPASVATLAERLGAAGYRSMGIGCGPWLHWKYGFRRGFDVYKKLNLAPKFAPRVRRDVPLLAPQAFPAERETPRFLFAHFYDAHSDFGHHGNWLTYNSPEEFRTDLAVARSEICGNEGRTCGTNYLKALQRDGRATPETMRPHFELYRRGARFLDQQLGLFFEELRALDLWDRAVVVVTADHGEEFGEHGGVLHQQVYRETTRVPLLVRLPGGRDGGRRILRPVTLADVAPTLLRFAGVEVPAGLDGRDLFEASGEREILQQDVRDAWGFGLRSGRWLLVGPRSGEPRFRLYDTDLDAAELTPLTDRTDVASRLENRLTERLRELRRVRDARTDEVETFDTEADVEDLRSLGYL